MCSTASSPCTTRSIASGRTRSRFRSTSRATSVPTTPRSSFFRRGEVPPMPDTPDGLPHVTERFVRPSKDYSWSSVVDHMAVEQAVGIWSGEYRDVTYPAPAVHVVQLHAHRLRVPRRRPHSEIAHASVRDTDARIGEILDAVERAGCLRRHRFRARRRPRHAADRPHRHGRLGRRACATRAFRSATRATGSSTSARASEPDARTASCRRPCRCRR